MRKTLIAFASIAALMATPAAAQELAGDVTITVQTDDLDLSAAADQARLDNRVENAIRRACRDGSVGIDARRAQAACRAALAETFAPQVEVAIMDASEERFAALELTPGA